MRIRTIVMLGVLLCVTAFSTGFDINHLGFLTKNLPKPTASLEAFDIKQISLKDITFTFGIGINNPYMIDLTLAGVDLDFSVEGSKVFHTTAIEGLTVKAKDKTLAVFDVTLTYDAIMKLVKDYNRRDYLTCDTAVLIRIPIPKTLQGLPPTVDFPFHLSQKIPAIKPRVNITNFSVTTPTADEVKNALANSMDKAAKKLDPNAVRNMFSALVTGRPVDTSLIKPADIDLKFKVGFDIVLQNETKAPIDFTSLQFGLKVNSSELIKGTTTQVQKDGTTTVLKVVNEFSSRNLTTEVLDAFKTGVGTFTLSGSTTIQLPPEILAHPLQLEFKQKGTFNLR